MLYDIYILTIRRIIAIAIGKKKANMITRYDVKRQLPSSAAILHERNVDYTILAPRNPGMV